MNRTRPAKAPAVTDRRKGGVTVRALELREKTWNGLSTPPSLERPERDCGRSPSRSAIAERNALGRLSSSSRSTLLRLVLRTQPRSGPLLHRRRGSRVAPPDAANI